MPLTGRSLVYFLLGDPIAQVRAPELYNPVFAAHGVDAVLVPVQVAPAQAADFARIALASGNVGGLFLTIPHKAALLDRLDQVDPIGRAAGAVNAVRRTVDGRLEGALFDGTGLVKALGHFGLQLADRRVLLLGVGGAGMAIAAALVAARAVLGLPPPAELALFDAVPGRADTVAARLTGPTLQVRALAAPDPAGYDLIINATPLGLNAGDTLPVDPARIDAGAAVVDILMKEADTPLVRACRARGLAAWPGHEMLVQQVGDHLRFFGHAAVAARVEADLAAVRALIQPGPGPDPDPAGAATARGPAPQRAAVSLAPAEPA